MIIVTIVLGMICGVGVGMWITDRWVNNAVDEIRDELDGME